MMRASPHRTVPVVGGVANTWIARRVDGTEALEVVEPFHRGKQRFTSGQHGSHGVRGVSVFREGRRTNVLRFGSFTSSIDHFLISKEEHRRLGRAVQVAPCLRAVDHMPLLMELQRRWPGGTTNRLEFRQPGCSAADGEMNS